MSLLYRSVNMTLLCETFAVNKITSKSCQVQGRGERVTAANESICRGKAYLARFLWLQTIWDTQPQALKKICTTIAFGTSEPCNSWRPVLCLWTNEVLLQHWTTGPPSPLLSYWHWLPKVSGREEPFLNPITVILFIEDSWDWTWDSLLHFATKIWNLFF